MNQKINNAFKKTVKSFSNIFPLIVGTVLAIALIFSLIPKEYYTKIFTSNDLINAFIGGFIGSISAGNPVTSYILGGELLSQGVGLVAVTSFLVAWVTVGILQIPLEAKTLGMKFTIARNISCFVFSIIISIITVLIYNAL